MSERILNIENLKVSFDTYAGEVEAVRGVSFHVNKGETLAIVGESGCGKSITVQSIMKLVPMPPGRLKEGTIEYLSTDITAYSDKKMQHLRGKEMSMIFQDPMTSLNPTMRIGQQILEGVKKHTGLKKKEAEEQIIRLLTDVGIPNPDKNMLRYPHMFSGGMRQRVMIAIALACNPKILFADEPTTALDVTTQAQILELMNALKEKFGTSIVLITHDLGIVARMADRVAVMYAGKIVETGSAHDIFYTPKHPYTFGLLKSLPSMDLSKETKLEIIPGTPASLINPPKGCSFADRCKYAMNVCNRLEPPENEISQGHAGSCWLLDERAPKVDLIKGEIL